MANRLRRLFQIECDLTSNSCGCCPFLRACFFFGLRSKKELPSLSHVLLQFWLEVSRSASKRALTCFVLISMVLRHWSSGRALRGLEACLQTVSLRQLRLKILARQHGHQEGDILRPIAVSESAHSCFSVQPCLGSMYLRFHTGTIGMLCG